MFEGSIPQDVFFVCFHFQQCQLNCSFRKACSRLRSRDCYCACDSLFVIARLQLPTDFAMVIGVIDRWLSFTMAASLGCVASFLGCGDGFAICSATLFSFDLPHSLDALGNEGNNKSHCAALEESLVAPIVSFLLCTSREAVEKVRKVTLTT